LFLTNAKAIKKLLPHAAGQGAIPQYFMPTRVAVLSTFNSSPVNFAVKLPWLARQMGLYTSGRECSFEVPRGAQNCGQVLQDLDPDGKGEKVGHLEDFRVFAECSERELQEDFTKESVNILVKPNSRLHELLMLCFHGEMEKGEDLKSGAIRLPTNKFDEYWRFITRKLKEVKSYVVRLEDLRAELVYGEHDVKKGGLAEGRFVPPAEFSLTLSSQP
jgi:hypothetical protein